MKALQSMLVVVAGLGLVTIATGQNIQAEKGAACEVCGMYIEAFKKTTVEVGLENGRKEHTCGLACGLRLINEQNGLSHVKSPLATDWNTQQPIPLEQATLVVGSDVTPDMIPNLIAFRTKEEAESFKNAHGGQVMPLEQALAGISYAGMTMPFRITPAPTPPQGLFSVGGTVSYMRKGDLLEGVHDASEQQVFAKKPMAPALMEGTMLNVMLAYAATDDIYVDTMLPYCWKSMQMDKKTGGGTSTSTRGIGDIQLSGRWRFYHDAMSDQHLAVVGRVILPSGDFTEENRARPGMQLGQEAFGFAGGLLFSQHLGLFWLNAGAEYRYNLENSSDYRFGDMLTGGVALHFVPCTRTMLGVEIDGNRMVANQDDSKAAPSTGYEAIFGNLVGQQRIANFWGGNFDLRAMVGIPLYQYMNGIQLGENYHLAAGVQWKRRF
ncbi:MAG: nitrous oxide reductase accessory protein NosL [Kiritimatiellaeota bacterium]|nr:nitrous oxide reductase accessory protein NosL [Kiritimatiellota bacterium]